MSIITISRGSYSRGKEVAEKLAAKLGYECLSRDVLLEASGEFNIPEMKLIRALHDSTSVLERFTLGKERYISYIYSSLLQHVRKDNVVYHGLAGHFFLSNIPHVLKVRIIADMQDRVKEEMRRENISAEKALYILKKDDEERRKWSLQMYGSDTWDSRLYDIVLHIGTITVDDAVDILYGIVQKPEYKATPDSLKTVEDLALAAKVKVGLFNLASKINIEADDGKVIIDLADDIQAIKNREEIKTLTGKMEGVKEVVIRGKSEQQGHVNPFQNIG
ncbi:MAG: cytidylate kinase-like family protein [Deltaproteobacteria bacterium]|nr:cytidylate kinase-like family protein [Deltaproteobacteria bacterium]